MLAKECANKGKYFTAAEFILKSNHYSNAMVCPSMYQAIPLPDVRSTAAYKI